MYQVNIFILLILLSAGAILLFRFKSRSSLDVLLDLEEDFEGTENYENLQNISINQRKHLRSFADICQKSIHQKPLLNIPWLLPILMACLSFSILIFIDGLKSAKLPVASMLGLSLGYLIRNYLVRRELENCQEEIERGLPLIMEELVMAVSAGHDVIAAIKITLNNRSAAKIFEPLTDIFKMVVHLSESGLTFADSLKQVGRIATVPAVKHALMHLALAYKDGGELVKPLRELADATQLMYQEKMEEHIAKLPVKATMPLVFIFAGLVIFFVTTPIIQVSKVTSKGIDIKGSSK